VFLPLTSEEEKGGKKRKKFNIIYQPRPLTITDAVFRWSV